MRRYSGEVMRATALWETIDHHPLSSGFKADNPYHLKRMILLQNTSQKKIPEVFSWGNVSGHSYLTPIRNQHIPTYCGSCWAFAPTSVLADRWNVKTRGSNQVMPHVVLSTQNVLSCGNDMVNCGTCHGGDDAAVFKYAERAGIPHESCSNYMARDTTCDSTRPPEGDNRPACYNCDEKAKCYAIPRFHKLFVKQNTIGQITNSPSAMRNEIYKNGPIVCAVMATKKMEHKYSSGVFAEVQPDNDARINHVVSIVGWGVDDDENSYWVARNSWGTEWGENGFMKIVTSENTGPAGTGNNLIEEECAFAEVDRFDYK
jgi:cathepsin X